MKKQVFFLISLLLILVGCNTDNNGENNSEQVKWAMGTSSNGSDPYILGSNVGNLINKNSELINLSAQVTGGYSENFSLIESGEVQIAQQNLYEYNLAYAGEEKYEGEPHENIRALFNASLMPVHIAVLEESGINSYSDLKGKRFNMGEPKQATYDIASKYLDTIGFSDDVKKGVLSTGSAADALRDKQQDAVLLLSNSPNSGLVQTSASKPINLLPIEGDIAEEFIEKLNNSVVKTTIPADTYEGQEEDIDTVAFPIVFYVNEDASEDEVYEFTKVFWENLNELHEEMPSTKGLTEEIAIEGINAPFHPGAERYFKEVGIMEK